MIEAVKPAHVGLVAGALSRQAEAAPDRMPHPADAHPVRSVQPEPALLGSSNNAAHGTKRATSWVGYTVHLTETCDTDTPHLITQVETTADTTSDISRVTPIHHALARKRLLPGQHLVDASYVSADELVASQTTYGVDLLGPIHSNGWWQAKAAQGYDLDRFHIDWQAQTATCPQGKTSSAGTRPARRMARTRSASLSRSATAHGAPSAACARAPRRPPQSDVAARDAAPGHPHRP